MWENQKLSRREEWNKAQKKTSVIVIDQIQYCVELVLQKRKQVK